MGAFIHKLSRSCQKTFDIITLNVWLCYSNRNTISHAVVFSKIKTCIQISIERITTMGTNKKTFGTRTEFSTARAGLGSQVWTDFNSFDYFRSCGNLDFCGYPCFHNLNVGKDIYKPYANICPVIKTNEVKYNSSQQ